MSDELYSPHWYRIAELNPKLRAHVRMQRQQIRGQPWYMLSEPSTNRHFRLNVAAYRFAGLCDGQRSVQAIWEFLTETLGDAAPTQGEVLGILGRMADSGMLQTESNADVESMFEGQAKREKNQTVAQLNPLFLRVPLFDPTSILRRLQLLQNGLFSRWALLLWLLLVVTAGTGAILHWQELSADAAAVAHSPRFLFLTWLVYPLIKLLHEFAHALAVRRWGGEVGKMGITLVLLTPIPWVDASAASAFAHRHQRFLVSAAGIMAELFLSSLAYFVWQAAEPGKLHDVALLVMLIGGVSTLLFNGNPLLRYDGYYMLCDALGMPNLAARSAAYWGYLSKRFILRLEPEAQTLDQRERLWLLCYGAASYVYRIFISVVILYYILGISRLVFVIASLFMAWSLLLKPLNTMLQSIWHARGSPAQSRRARWLGLGAITLVAGFLTLVPLPHWSIAEGVVWLPEGAYVRAQTEGFVRQTHAQDGARVKAGDLLLTLEDPLLLAQREKLAGQWQALQAKYYNALQAATGDAKSMAGEMASVEVAIQRNAERIEQLQVRAGDDGTLVLPRQQDLPGQFARRGDNFGYILPQGNMRVRAVISQQDAELVAQRTRDAEVWLSETQTVVRASLTQSDMAAASKQLPSAALGDRGGGSFATDPKDPKGMTALEPFLLIDLDLPDTSLARVGGRAVVRLELERESLLLQVWRRLRQVFLLPTNAS